MQAAEAENVPLLFINVLLHDNDTGDVGVEMAKKKDDYKGYDISTRAVHTGNGYDEGTGAVRRPLHMANSYKLPDDLSQVN